ncbi:hypothetical protein CDN98_19950 [Roseateles terrae]|nr:hypothetical protein CDN98_19950 [Roseateles terrae]
MPHQDVLNDRGAVDPPVPHGAVPNALRAIQYNQSDAACLLRLLGSMDPVVAALPTDTKAQYIERCDSIASYRSLHADNIRADRPSLRHGPFARPDPVRQSHAHQAFQDRDTLKDITRHLSELTASHMAESALNMQFQMAALDKVASGVIPRPAILRQAEAFLKSHQRTAPASDPDALGVGKVHDWAQRFTMQMKYSITAFERLQDLGAKVPLKALGAQREAYIETFVAAQNAAGRSDRAGFEKHFQTLQQLSAIQRRSQERTSLTMP